MAEPTVTIPVSRLAELEALAAIGQKHKEKNEADFKRLAERHKADPQQFKEVVKQWKARNRESYNARRRELYRLKKEEAKSSTDASVSPKPAVCPTDNYPGPK